MLDIAELDKALKLKLIGNVLQTSHPLLSKLIAKAKLDDFYHPSLEKKVDSFISEGLKLLGEDRRRALGYEQLKLNTKLLGLLGTSKIINWVRPEARNSIALFNLRRRGISKLKDLTDIDLRSVEPLIPGGDLKVNLLRAVPLARRLQATISNEDFKLYPVGGTLRNLEKCSSKEIRTSRADKDVIVSLKIGLTLTRAVSFTWFNNIAHLTSIRHRNILLRVIHGEIYSKERLFRFGLSDNNLCEHCNEVETIVHKFFECRRVANLWDELTRITNGTLPNPPDRGTIGLSRQLGAFLNTNITLLTAHAELLTLLQGNIQGWPNPAAFIKTMLRSLCRKEDNEKVKTELIELYNSNY